MSPCLPGDKSLSAPVLDSPLWADHTFPIAREARDTPHRISFFMNCKLRAPGLTVPRGRAHTVRYPYIFGSVCGGSRQRAAAVKAAVEDALVDVGRRTSVVAKPIAERSVTGGVGRVGAFEVQVRQPAYSFFFPGPCAGSTVLAGRMTA